MVASRDKRNIRMEATKLQENMFVATGEIKVQRLAIPMELEQIMQKNILSKIKEVVASSTLSRKNPRG